MSKHKNTKNEDIMYGFEESPGLVNMFEAIEEALAEAQKVSEDSGIRVVVYELIPKVEIYAEVKWL